MATGTLALSPAWVDSYIRTTDNWATMDPPLVEGRVFDGGPLVTATPITDNLPVSQAAISARPGAQARSYHEDWYDRIHVIPGALPLGNLVSAQERTIEVWNAWSVPRRLVDLTSTGTDGLTLAEPAPPPTQYGALESRLYTLSVSLDGPPTIDARYVFAFDVQSPQLHVTGARVIGFAFRPNWATPVIERLQWRTDVLTARDGSEQRIALRSIPRRELEFAVLAQGVQAARADALLWGWGARVYALPIWTDPHILPADLPAGATAITVPTQYRDYAADALAVLWLDDAAHELVEVLSVGAGSITLKRPTEVAWPAGTRVLPARLARLADSATVRRHSAAVGELPRLRWRIEPLQPLGGIEGPAPTQYQGEEVYLIPPNRVEPLDDEYSRTAAWIDGDTGPLAVDDPAQRPDLLRDYAWLLRDRQAISAFKRFLTDRKGRLKPVYVPTWQRDLELAATLGAGATTLVVHDIGYRRYYVGVPGRQDVAIRLPDGTWALRRITAADQVVAGQERLTLDSGLPAQIDPGAYITLLGLHRLDADQVELAWRSAEVAEARTRLRTVPA